MMERTDAGWYQGNVKLIACEDERSAALYKAANNKVGEVYAGAKLAVCEAADILSRPRQINQLGIQQKSPQQESTDARTQRLRIR